MASLKWSEEENKLLKSNYSILKNSDLLQIFPNRTREAIKTQAHRLNLKSANLWTDKEIELLKNNYSVLNIESLLLLFPNRAKTSIQVKASSLKLKAKRNHTFNESVFEHQNVLNSYYAGFITADGCITDSNNLKIELKQSDNNFLDKFNTFMECSREIKYYSRKQYFKKFTFVYVSYQSEKLAKDLLSNFLIKPRKTLNCTFPKHLNLENKLSYIIGNLDGDGCIRRNTQNAFDIQWLGDFNFLNYIRNLFFRLGWIKDNTKYLTKKTDSGLYKLNFTRKIAEFIYKKLINHIEKHSLPVLERKWFKTGIPYFSFKHMKIIKN